MRTKTGLVLAATAALALAACSKLPGGGPKLPGGLPSTATDVDPNTCGNYAASDAGAKLKVFLQAIKDLQAATADTIKVVKNSCVIMGQELGMADADLGGDDTKAICNKVIATYKDNLKVAFKAGAKLKIVMVPGQCKVDASASASASGSCSGAAGTGGVAGGCQASAQAQASIHAECTPPQFSIEADAKLVVDKSKAEMTLKALRDGIPKLLDVKARIQPMSDAVIAVVKAASDLKDAGKDLVSSFGDQALCITQQLALSVKAAANIQANVSVSVEVSASASGSVGG
jgi:hypothetical protein